MSMHPSPPPAVRIPTLALLASSSTCGAEKGESAADGQLVLFTRLTRTLTVLLAPRIAVC